MVCQLGSQMNPINSSSCSNVTNGLMNTVPLWEYVLRIVSIASFILITIFLNLLVIYGIFKITKFPRASHRLLLNLFISDMLVGFIVMPTFMMNLISSGADIIYSGAWCCFNAFLKTAIMLFSLYSLTILCFERFVMFQMPIKHRTMFKSTWPFILIAVILSLCIPTVALLTFDVVHFPRQHLCWFNPRGKKFVFVFLFILFGLPVIFLQTSSAVIIKARTRHAGNTKQTYPYKGSIKNKSFHSVTRPMSKSRATLIVSLMVLAFHICYVPNMITFFCEVSGHCQISERLAVGSKFLHFSKSFANAVIYGFLNSQIRERILHIFHKKISV